MGGYENVQYMWLSHRQEKNNQEKNNKEENQEKEIICPLVPARLPST